MADQSTHHTPLTADRSHDRVPFEQQVQQLLDEIEACCRSRCENVVAWRKEVDEAITKYFLRSPQEMHFEAEEQICLALKRVALRVDRGEFIQMPQWNDNFAVRKIVPVCRIAAPARSRPVGRVPFVISSFDNINSFDGPTTATWIQFVSLVSRIARNYHSYRRSLPAKPHKGTPARLEFDNLFNFKAQAVMWEQEMLRIAGTRRWMIYNIVPEQVTDNLIFAAERVRNGSSLKFDFDLRPEDLCDERCQVPTWGNAKDDFLIEVLVQNFYRDHQPTTQSPGLRQRFRSRAQNILPRSSRRQHETPSLARISHRTLSRLAQAGEHDHIAVGEAAEDGGYYFTHSF